MPSRWRPLDVREGGDAEQYDGPHEGMPDWLFPSVWDWVHRQTPRVRHQFDYSSTAVTYYRDMAMALRTRFDRGDPSGHSVEEGLLDWVSYDLPRLLLVVDFMLAHPDPLNSHWPEDVGDLQTILSAGGSAYEVCVGDDAACYLSHRVTPEMRAAADEVMAPRDKASQHLSRAWKDVYSQHPSPGHGYSEAVKAVEVVSIPVVSPKNARATLGTVVGNLRDAPQNWSIGLFSREGFPQVLALANTLDLLWQGQLRHGDPKPDVPLDVTSSEAEAALHLAVALVKWFRDGTIRRA